MISVVIPVYNEENNIDELIRQCVKILSDESINYEIIIVNDGSEDNTGKKCNEIAEKNNAIKVIHLKRNFGQTAAIMAGLDHSEGDVIVTLDGDLQNDPKDIPRLLNKLNDGYDVCSGWRKHRMDNPVTRTLPSRIANAIISLISGVKLNDYGCTLKAYRKETIENVKLYGEMHRFIPIYATWQGAKVTELPVVHHPRKTGKSKYGLDRTFKVVLDLIVIKFMASFSQKPIHVFGGFGLINFLLSFLCSVLMFYYKFWGNKSFVQTPLPQIVVLFFLMGFLSVFMGLLAEMQMRTYYESQRKTTYIVGTTVNFEVNN